MVIDVGNLILIYGSTNTLEFVAESVVDASPINDASIELTIADADGQPYGSYNWPASLQYVDLTDGVYRVELPPLAIPNPGEYVEGLLSVQRGTRVKTCFVPITVRRCDGITRDGK